MKDILGLRASTDNAGALTEIGWTDVETKATKARLLFWWRLGRTDSALMRKLERQAHLQQKQETKNETVGLQLVACYRQPRVASY